MARASTNGAARVVERVCWTLACVATLLYVAATTDATIHGNADLARAATATAHTPATANVRSPAPIVDTAPRALEASDLQGLLEIPSLNLRTPIYSDTSEVNLNRGAGLIAGMSMPGQGGNLGVAAHRDGIFRALENIRVGAAIEVRSAGFQYVYRVTSIAVVDRTDAALLRRTAEPAITLVTCYPFRFIGAAPWRFVVRGRLDSIREAAASMTPTPREKTAAI